MRPGRAPKRQRQVGRARETAGQAICAANKEVRRAASCIAPARQTACELFAAVSHTTTATTEPRTISVLINLASLTWSLLPGVKPGVKKPSYFVDEKAFTLRVKIAIEKRLDLCANTLSGKITAFTNLASLT